METHVKVLGILNIVSGVLGLFGAIVLIVIFGGVAGLVGAEGGDDAAFVVPLLGGIGGVLALITIVVSLPNIIIGFGLYKMEPWGRIAGIVVSVLNLFWFPVGTALGIYGLWVLFSAEGKRIFESPQA